MSENTFTGDVSDFVSLGVAFQTITPNMPNRVSASTLAATFTPTGQIATFALTFRGDVDTLFLNSTGLDLVSGTYSSDRDNCGECAVSGWIVRSDVPEPMSLALLGMAAVWRIA